MNYTVRHAVLSCPWGTRLQGMRLPDVHQLCLEKTLASLSTGLVLSLTYKLQPFSRHLQHAWNFISISHMCFMPGLFILQQVICWNLCRNWQGISFRPHSLVIYWLAYFVADYVSQSGTTHLETCLLSVAPSAGNSDNLLLFNRSSLWFQFNHFGVTFHE